jgi:hypothetical protein
MYPENDRVDGANAPPPITSGPLLLVLTVNDTVLDADCTPSMKSRSVDPLRVTATWCHAF